MRLSTSPASEEPPEASVSRARRTASAGVAARRGGRTPTGDPLLGARFAVPAPPRTHVVRRRLLARLAEGAAGPVTLVSGPAGTGKTVLMASWAAEEQPPGPVVWLTTEPDNNAPGVFWAYTLEAFRHHGVTLGDGIGVPTHADHVDRSLLTRLACALSRLPEPVVLVLDDFDEVRSREVAAGLEFVVRHAGPQLRLMLVSRLEPLLPLHRHRAAGQLTEIDGADLAFTPRETALLLRRHGLDPSPDSVRTLSARTGGWATGLRFSALSLQRGDAPYGSPAGHDAVADYLTAEVLAPQPAPVRDLLVRSSVLERVHPGLADELTGRDDAARTLAALARAHAFVEAETGTGWYRCHPLFAEVLRARLRLADGALEPELHRRAARWLAAAGDLDAALPHAAAARDFAFAAGFLVDNLAVGRLLLGPGADAFAELRSAVAPDQPDAGAAVHLVAAACALARDDAAGCPAHLERARRALADDAPAAPASRLSLALLGLLAGSGTAEGDGCAAADRAAAEVRDLLAHLPGRCAAEHPELPALARYGAAAARLRAGRLDDAEHAFRELRESCTDPVTRPLHDAALGAVALIESLRGALTAAEAHAQQALAAGRCTGPALLRPWGTGHLALAGVASERHELPAVKHHLQLAAAEFGAPLDPVVRTECAVIRSRLDVATGDVRGALGGIETLAGGLSPEDTDGAPAAPTWLEERAAVALSAAHLAAGDPERAVAVLAPGAPGHPARLVALARARLAAGDASGARDLLAALSDAPGAGTADRVRLRLLQARMAELDEEPRTARRLLGQALRLARPELLRRPFTDSGAWVGQLLRDGAGTTEEHDWLTVGAAGGGAPPEAGGGPEPVIVASLTDREREVLAQAAGMLSTEEIAAELCLSVNTVKTHLKSIYRKLSASRRSEAVRRARSLGLL
ncbi:LuxR C-terminal-related transcriptional regulator [Streptomyces sp. NPDC002055]|uniref:LuxR C-terminal-related transcriptional regulator n=1 Tax=Streptomyces sp. NPDC002055 TaxID=3154534 RepID=UPI003332C335